MKLTAFYFVKRLLITYLPDHLHFIWTLPEHDSDYSTHTLATYQNGIYQKLLGVTGFATPLLTFYPA